MRSKFGVALLAAASLHAGDTCMDWPVRRTREAMVFEEIEGDRQKPFLIISQLSRTAMMFGPSTSIVLHEDGSTDILPEQRSRYTKGTTERRDFEKLMIAFVDYVAACGTNWKVKTWQELLAPKCSACHSLQRGARDQSIIQSLWSARGIRP